MKMVKIVPTVGRVILYWPQKAYRGDQPWPAIVTYVHGDNMVNLAVWNSNGQAMNSGTTSVLIVQDGSPFVAGDSPYAQWMDYQKGQAAKAEKAEAELAAVAYKQAEEISCKGGA